MLTSLFQVEDSGRKKKCEQEDDERKPIGKWTMLWFVPTPVLKRWKMVGWTGKRDGFNTYGEKSLDEEDKDVFDEEDKDEKDKEDEDDEKVKEFSV